MEVGRVKKNTAIHCQFRLVYSKLRKTALIRFNRAKQLNRRRQSTVSMPGKRSQANLNRKPKSYLFTNALVYTKLDFYVFHIDFSDIFFLLIILANCVRDESCGEKIAPISPRGRKFVAQTVFCIHR